MCLLFHLPYIHIYLNSTSADAPAYFHLIVLRFQIKIGRITGKLFLISRLITDKISPGCAHCSLSPSIFVLHLQIKFKSIEFGASI